LADKDMARRTALHFEAQGAGLFISLAQIAYSGMLVVRYSSSPGAITPQSR
jgi:hypothetical protein